MQDGDHVPALSPLSLRRPLGQRSAHSPTLTPQKPTGQACAEEGRQSLDRRWDGVTRWLISLTTPRAEHSSSSFLSVVSSGTGSLADRKNGVQAGPRDQAYRGERVQGGRPGLGCIPASDRVSHTHPT